MLHPGRVIEPFSSVQISGPWPEAYMAFSFGRLMVSIEIEV